MSALVIGMAFFTWQAIGLGRAATAAGPDATSAPAPKDCGTVESTEELGRRLASTKVDATWVDQLEQAAEKRGSDPALASLEARLEPSIGRLRATIAERYAAGFGGLWVDFDDTITVTIADIPHATELRTFVCQSFVAPSLVRFVDAEASYAELNAELRKLSEWRTQLMSEGGPAFDMNHEERTGKITVILAEETKATDRAQILEQARTVTDRPAALEIETVEKLGGPSSCTRSDCRPDMLGGLAISTCTSGFSATRNGVDGVVTAGHCGDFQQHATRSLGSVVVQQEMYNVDAQFHNTSANWPATRPLTYRNTGLFEVESVRNFAHDFDGLHVCMSGKMTNWTCGDINDLDFAPWWVPSSYGFRKAGYSSIDGDSGAPVTHHLQGVGINSGHSGSGDGVFGSLQIAENSVGFNVKESPK